MSRADFHVHTTFCDGKNTPREMVEAAIQKGLSTIGFSAHSFTSFDESYCILEEREAEYRAEIQALAKEYRNQIRILCGIEQDVYADQAPDVYDYTIGSVHYIKKDGIYYPVDESPAVFANMCEEGFGGDYYALCEAYYETVASIADTMEPDIIGHFDLVTKFNEGNLFFDETNPRYVEAWQYAMDALLPLDVPFEVNTGAMSRGYREMPYPSSEQLLYLADNGGSVILSGDAHSADSLCYAFDEWEDALFGMGLSIVTL